MCLCEYAFRCVCSLEWTRLLAAGDQRIGLGCYQAAPLPGYVQYVQSVTMLLRPTVVTLHIKGNKFRV
jgi:hypothetical protein